ncbi:MAG TPA: flavin reductase family protein, partial [Sporichthya sp.]|nr:flavin reductase family protein [Sporichthya sp.]
SRRRHILAVGGGSGVTPLLAIAAAVLGSEPASRVTFLLANRSSDRIMLGRELDQLVRLHPDRFRLVHVLDQGAAGQELAGPLDASLLHRVGGRLEIATVDESFLCGPGPMMDSVRAGLTDLGADPASIHCERFTAPIPAARSESSGVDVASRQVTVVIGGRSVPVAGARSESVLDAGLRAGLPLPYSCRAGYCGTCAAVVTPGAPGAGAVGEVMSTCQLICSATELTVDFDDLAGRAERGADSAGHAWSGVR